jgi:hypothetical protein
MLKFDGGNLPCRLGCAENGVTSRFADVPESQNTIGRGFDNFMMPARRLKSRSLKPLRGGDIDGFLRCSRRRLGQQSLQTLGGSQCGRSPALGPLSGSSINHLPAAGARERRRIVLCDTTR